jgi:hypothetical protein
VTVVEQVLVPWLGHLCLADGPRLWAVFAEIARPGAAHTRLAKGGVRGRPVLLP